MTFEFKPWPKIPRLNRDIVITEKIDGTNACVIVTLDLEVGAQSRNRVITPESDNYGFAKWVHENQAALSVVLGPGYHYGEWWGSGIQRGYGLPKGEKRFSLFNTSRWEHLVWADDVAPGLTVVPVLYEGMYGDWAIDEALNNLNRYGSKANPGFDRPEGLVVFHTASNQVFKVTIDNDEAPKGLAS